MVKSKMVKYNRNSMGQFVGITVSWTGKLYYGLIGATVGAAAVYLALYLI